MKPDVNLINIAGSMDDMDGQSSSGSCRVDREPVCQSPETFQGFDSEPGLTFEKLANALNLPADFLKLQGVSDKKRQGVRMVRVPYLDEHQELVATRLFQSLHGSGRFERQPLRVVPYGLWQIDAFREKGRILIVPSELDCWVCWHQGIPALGLPATAMDMEKCLLHLKDLEIYLWDGNFDWKLVKEIGKHLTDTQVISAPEGMDRLWQAFSRGNDLKAVIKKAREAGVSPVSTVTQAWRETRINDLRQQAAHVLESHDPLEVIKEAIQSLGYGGDLKIPTITYLAVTSRVLTVDNYTMPVHLLLIAQPGVGKSYTLNTVLRLLPEEAYCEIKAGSQRVLIYDDAELHHRALVFSEADSLPSGEENPAASALRNLMTDHRLHYKVVISDPEGGGFQIQEIDKEGPTALLTTAVKRLPSQLDSRVFTLEVPDDKNQIQAALRTQAQLELWGRTEPDPGLIALQSLLQELAPWEVVVPFVDRLAEKMSELPHAGRLNRDFARLLSLIKSIAVLRHHWREVDEKNRIVAQLADYETIYHLVNKMFETSVNKVSDKTRRVVQAVAELNETRTFPISLTEVGNHLGTTKQSVSATVKSAIFEGWLVNSETRRGYPFNLDLGEPLPDSIGLPKPEELVAEEAKDARGQSMDTMDTVETSAMTSKDVSDTQVPCECQGVTPPPSDEKLSSNVVNMFKDGDSESFSQVSPVKCANCMHFEHADWGDGHCIVTGEYFPNSHEEHPCEHFKLKERSAEALLF